MREPGALRIAREGLNLELLEQPAKLSLDRLDAEHELLSDLAVGRRFSEFASVAIGAAKGNQHASLRARKVDLSRACSESDRLTGLPKRGAVEDASVAEAQQIAIHQAASLAQSLAVHDRAVA